MPALRRPSHEGRGLKSAGSAGLYDQHQSPLTRGAWIEIQSFILVYGLCYSRPSHEGRGLKFDRPMRSTTKSGRPSHEGRGLKSEVIYTTDDIPGRPSHEGRGLKFAPQRNSRPLSVAPHTRGVD